MGKTLGELADIARAAWMECDLTGDHWAATAKAVRKTVLGEAIETVRMMPGLPNNYRFAVQAKLQRLMEESNDPS